MTDLPLLHIGGASTASVIISLGGIFLLMLIMSFAFWRGPQDHRRFSTRWFIEWIKASAPRIVIAGIFCAGLFTASALSGSSTNANNPTLCRIGLPALTAQPVTPQRIDAGVQGLLDLADAARNSDLEQARILILSDAHNITHDVDPRLRPVDETLARDLCNSITVLENEIANKNPDLTKIADEAERSADLLAQARDVIATTTPTPGPFSKPGSGACDTPIGRITTNPVTAERIVNAVSKLQAMANAAADSNTGVMAGLFLGDAHDITHDIDGPLRDVDLELAKELCLSILNIEIQLGGTYDLATIETEATKSAALLVDAGEALGLGQ